MTLNRYAAVYDSNVYRALCRRLTPREAIAAAERLAGDERSAGILPVASQAVAVELARHLSELGDTKLAECLSALCMLAVHCNQDVGGLGHVRFMHMSDDILSKALYGGRTQEALEFTSTINTIVLTVLDDPTPVTLLRIRDHLRALAVFVDNVERSYVNLLTRFASRMQAEPTGSRALYRRLLAGSYGREEAARYLVQRCRQAFGLDGPEPRMDELQSIVLAKFPAAVAFAVQQVARIVDGAVPALDANSVWDWELAFVLGRSIAPVEGDDRLSIRVVTEDKAIHKAALAGGVPQEALTLDAHRSQLHSSSEDGP